MLKRVQHDERTMPITYKDAGVSYASLDPAKILASKAAAKTGKNLGQHGVQELAESRGESAYVFKIGNTLMATVIEGLGTKHLVADAMRKITHKTYYDAIAYDTVGCVLNDLVSVGAQPLVIHAYWGVGSSDWFEDKPRIRDFVNGWKKACDDAGASWGGGETPTNKGIVDSERIDLAGSAVGIIRKPKQLITEKKMKTGDHVLLLKSSGINANGLTLARKISESLPKGYATKLPSGQMYGEALLKPQHLYAKLVNALLDQNIDIHYIANITGHGWRKIMRARGVFTYRMRKIPDCGELFRFIQDHAELNDEQMYGTFNMGADYAIILPGHAVAKAQSIIKKLKFDSLDAGVVEKGKKQVIIEPLNIAFGGETLALR